MHRLKDKERHEEECCEVRKLSGCHVQVFTQAHNIGIIDWYMALADVDSQN
jgi:hypothetical protein